MGYKPTQLGEELLAMRFLTVREYNDIKLLLTMSSIGEVVMNSKQSSNYSVDTVRAVDVSESYEAYTNIYEEAVANKEKLNHDQNQVVHNGMIWMPPATLAQLSQDLKEIKETLANIEKWVAPVKVPKITYE